MNSLQREHSAEPYISKQCVRHTAKITKDESVEFSRAYEITKRCFDVAAASVMLVPAFPLMAVFMLLICLTSKGAPIYKHERVGKNGKKIYLLKLRTMVQNADNLMETLPEDLKREWHENFKLENDPRITKIGNFLRKTSLDELPQLLNVIKGDLSMVGPRPVVEEELKKYGANKDKFLSVTPGLTGYWQAYARSDCSYEQRMRMELEYVDHANWIWDVKILFRTVGIVLRCKGAK